MSDRLPTAGRSRLAASVLAAGLLAAVPAWPQPEPVMLRPGTDGDGPVSASISLPVTFPGEIDLSLEASDGAWARSSRLVFRVAWPADAAAGAQALVYMMDDDYAWFQYLVPEPLSPGVESEIEVRLDGEESGWTPQGHQGVWSRLHRHAPRAFGLRLYGAEPVEGEVRVGPAHLVPEPDAQPPPWIRFVEASASVLPRFERLQVDFQLPDRYIDPFDPNEVDVGALIDAPDGTTVRVNGFFRQDYIRTENAHGEYLIAQGRPGWSVRFTPTQEGVYHYRLHVRDRWGEATWGPAMLTAGPAERRGFLRVSQTDPRFFEYEDGTFFFPIGHNIRSTFDQRHDTRFPWAHREQTGTAAYRDYFEAMAASGQNFVEVWMASWSLGLEWSPVRPGYRGVGWFNLRHAWELDRVVDWAEAFGLHINLVIQNHGKFSDWVDQEWEANPFNTALGGYLERPQDYFTDPRAQEAFRKLMRYILARWASSPAVFSWELWNELDLTGTRGQNPRVHQCPHTVAWHRDMGRWIRESDPHRRPIGTHVCGDYTHQNPALVELPEIDYAPINAYHREENPMHIVDLLLRSAAFNAQFGKPVLVTEFGGSPSAHQGVRHLEDELYAALWASTAVPVAGTPLFWWWHLIAEEGWYRKYAAIERFMRGIDRRDPSAETLTLPVRVQGRDVEGLRALVYRSAAWGNGWIYAHDRFPMLDPYGPPVAEGAVLEVEGMGPGSFEIEFWDPVRGEQTGSAHAASEEGRLVLDLPPFGRDLALRFRRVP